MYPLDRRKTALHIRSLGLSLRKIATLLQTSHTTIARWLKNPDRKIYTRKVYSKEMIVVDCIKSCVMANPTSPLSCMKKIIEKTLSINVSKQLIRVVLSKHGYTRKKARYSSEVKNHESKLGEFLKLRDAFIHQGKVFYSVDETSFGRHCKAPYGYALKGQRLYLRLKKPGKKTCSTLAIISDERIIKIEHSLKPFNTYTFYEFITSIEFPMNAVLLLDNVSFHHSKLLKEYAELISLPILFIPPYSPWFNPIEGVFSIVKRKYYEIDDIDYAFQSVKEYHIKSFYNHSLELKEKEKN
jgi:transposase